MAFYRIFVTLLTAFAFAPVALQACIDSLKVSITPVQCYGLRNGKISIDTVYGGEGPFYFSIDSVTWSTRPEFDRLWAGDYTLLARNAQGCTYMLDVTVPEPALLTVALSADQLLVSQGDLVTITAAVEPPDAPLAKIAWRPPGLTGITDSLVLQTRLSNSTTIAISIETANGCSAWDQLEVKVEKPQLFIPNAFQPGSVTNSYFTVYTDFSVSAIKLLQVYDRSGALLFERKDFWPNDPTLGWNGRWRGKPAAPGVYTWKAAIQFLDGHIEEHVGTVTVF
ncbi:MAG: hypothetical protein SFV52_15590 [Saprospiraceae bacterium]|nr:hypothetical protein [Saprospiraceae bacterium]